MDTTTLQVPLTKKLKSSATAAAREQGFSSLQDFVRLILSKLVDRELGVNVGVPVVRLSKKNARRYAKMDEDFKKGKNVYHADSVEDFIRQLHESRLPS